jgi:hypothetical protein
MRIYTTVSVVHADYQGGRKSRRGEEPATGLCYAGAVDNDFVNRISVKS